MMKNKYTDITLLAKILRSQDIVYITILYPSFTNLFVFVYF